MNDLEGHGPMRTALHQPIPPTIPALTTSGVRTGTTGRLSAALALAMILSVNACGSSDADVSAPSTSSATTASSTPTNSPAGTGEQSAAAPPATSTTAASAAAGAPGGNQGGADQARTETLTVPAGTRSPQLTWSSTSDPNVIAAMFVAATWQMDAKIDTGPTQAQQRAAQLGTAALAATLSQAPVSGGGAAWGELVSRNGWTSVEASATSTPDAPDTATERFRLVNATITAHGNDGWTSTALFPPVVVYVSLVPDGSSWRVEDATTYSS